MVSPTIRNLLTCLIAPELREIIPRTPASPQVATPEVFQEIETWINDCLEDHVECPKNVNTLLPTRVLDVFSNTSSEGVSLHISSSGECGRYTALSYCWGAGTQTRTLWENLKQHTQSLRVASLPQTIQDAIRVTRALKIQYLWVDALCIIQDSLDNDWPREAGRMPEIYKNAVVTISAAAAVNSNHGFLEDRQSILLAQAQSSRFPVYKLMSDDEESGDVATLENIGEVFVTQDEELGYNTKEFDDEHINTRAWTLQETWLSPRLLCFGSGLPKWICLKHERAYGVDKTKSRSSWNKRDMVRSQIFTARSLSSENTDIIPIHDQLGRTEYLREWWSLFIDYSRRKLTVKTDKMVAISGIAKEFGLLLNDQYVAGLWESSLPHSLLWRHENQPHEENARKERRKRDRFIAFFASNTSTKEPYIAPSWSPFANNGSVYMSYPSGDGGQTLCVINELRVEPANALAPFHGVKPGYAWIEVTAPMTHMSYEEIITHFVVVTDGSPHIYWDWILPDGGAANKYLGPAGKLQMRHPQLNPQVLTDIRTTLTLGGDPPLVRESSQRPTPPSKTADPWPQLIDKKKHARGVPDADFWLLEIGHTTVPTGLVLVQLAAGRFKRIGMFRMGRNQSPNWQWVNGYEISGPRRWDWDTRLEMRNCIIT
ncbi:hypothetical protein ACMFMG_004379 [Clarireedia jacksonii]